MKRNDWQLPETEVTPIETYRSRRQLLKQAGLGLAGSFTAPLLAKAADWEALLQASKGLQIAPGSITKKELVTTYNNFYEFSLKKEEVHKKAQGFPTHPWEVSVGGLVEKPIRIEAEELIRKFTKEQRIYRFRCVEAWSMVVPWDGFALAELIKWAKPLSKAKYVEFKSFYLPQKAPGQRDLRHYPWPYAEGLRLDEAMNELAFLSTGIYGEALPVQNGAPLRLVVPWKYGFKSIKSIREINFLESQPKTLWNSAAPGEYGFYANVNPEVAHPRWSQATEKVLGSWFQRVPTQKFNGYGEQVAHLYQGMDLAKYF